MSFSSTLYRISDVLFRQVEAGLIEPKEFVSKSKDFVTFQDSGDAIIFLLKKRRERNGAELIDEIFFPTEKLGAVSDEVFEKLIASSNYKEIERISASAFYFLPPKKVATLNSFLDSLDSLEIRTLYDFEELNSRNIYPSLWTPDEDKEKAYNLSHLQDDLKSLKEIFEKASREKDYILTFNG
jgi:hypothetical protein